MDGDFDKDIIHAAAPDNESDNYITNLTCGIYTGIENTFQLKEHLQSLYTRTLKDVDDQKKRPNLVTSPGPHFINKLHGGRTHIMGNGCWTYAGDGSNRLRFEENIKLKK
jgi:hypothetical protein